MEQNADPLTREAGTPAQVSQASTSATAAVATQVAEHAEEWSIEDAIKTYNVDRWGLGYFGINEQGHVSILPQRNGHSIDIMDVIAEAKEQELRFPLVVRFQDLLRDRVVHLNKAFLGAIEELKFGGQYLGVFPIKVNQLREVVEEIADAGRPFNYGMEAGSKPELFAALAVHDNPSSLLICNGYKDTQFIRTALLGNRLGKKVIMVAEKVEEVKAIVTVSQEMGIEPIIGIRVRLAAKSSGIWATSGGESAKFGLNTMDLMQAVNYLRDVGMLHTFKLVHYHIGSQIPDIHAIKRSTREGARYYAKLRNMGCDGLEYLDMGGGLGVDYDGSRTSFHSSTNYTLEEYATDTIYNIMDVCDEEKVPHPHVISESGRAIVAHHSMLVVEVFGSIEKTKSEYDLTVEKDDHKWVKTLADINERIHVNPTEALHDVQQIKQESQSAFDLGILDLRTKAKIETFYWHIVEEIVELFHRKAASGEMETEDIPEDVADLTPHMADQYVCNFSVFQSLLDHWALGQLFPIMPLHRLNEPPNAQGTLVDITCDSDGKVSKFIDLKDVRQSLPMHQLRGEEPYYIGCFMTGAYQDIMGDLHNLFGRVNEAHLFLDDDEESGWYVEETIPGHSISQVLEMVQYHGIDLARRMKAQIDEAIKADTMRPNEGMKLLAEYERGLQDPTYLRFSS
jgi:arginine decarboxylase